MRECGGCTLCCKIAKVKELQKPTNQWCQHCDIGVGCKRYGDQPKECAQFRCLWLDSEMDEGLRPDRVGFYVTLEGDVAKVNADRKVNYFAHHKVVEDLRAERHVITQQGYNVSFIPSGALPLPEQLTLNWTL